MVKILVLRVNFVEILWLNQKFWFSRSTFSVFSSNFDEILGLGQNLGLIKFKFVQIFVFKVKKLSKFWY